MLGSAFVAGGRFQGFYNPYRVPTDEILISTPVPTTNPEITLMEIEDTIVLQTNIEREKVGLPKLTRNKLLDKSAKLKSLDMINRNYWSHNAPNGTETWQFFKKVGYSYRHAGENLAREYMDGPSIMSAWLDSPSHKDNIVSPKYSEIGVHAHYESGSPLFRDQILVVVQHFGTPYKAPLK